MVPSRRSARERPVTPTSLQRLTDGELEVTVATSFGPRVTGFALAGDRNVFAELGDMGIDLGDGRTYPLRGGHRLWVAPEVPEITYEPDDAPVVVGASSDTLVLTRTGTPPVGITKGVGVRIEAGKVNLDHVIVNQGDRAVDVAPWGITQLVPGGTAIIPLPEQPADPHGLQPNSSIVLWPYTGVADSPFVMSDRLILLDGNRSSPTKIGVAMQRGWLAYVIDDLVFVKRAAHIPSGRYLDCGASGQCHSGPDFLELETLGERVVLEPGEGTSHSETWELHRIDPTTPPQLVPGLLDLDGDSPP